MSIIPYCSLALWLRLPTLMQFFFGITRAVLVPLRARIPSQFQFYPHLNLTYIMRLSRSTDDLLTLHPFRMVEDTRFQSYNPCHANWPFISHPSTNKKLLSRLENFENLCVPYTRTITYTIPEHFNGIYFVFFNEMEEKMWKNFKYAIYYVKFL